MTHKVERQARSLANSEECIDRFETVYTEGKQESLDYVSHLEYVINKLTNEFITHNDELTIEPDSGETLFKAIFQRQISEQFQRTREISVD